MNQGKYSKLLKLGNEIEMLYFDRQVLDRYKDNPIFNVEEFGASGTLHIKDKYFSDRSVKNSDKIEIQSFVIGYKPDGTEVVGVILVYLARLSSEHQKHWESFEVKEKCKIDADSFDQEFGAEFTLRMSPFKAILQEIMEINKICDLIGYVHLFSKTFENINGFGWITKPTLEEIKNIYHNLDKLFSENINKKFFIDKISLKDGSDNYIGTISLLENYLMKFRFNDPKPKDEMMRVFRNIRKERQKPAHTLEENKYDKRYFDTQKDIIREAYIAIRTLRLIFMNHPKAKEYKPPDWLQFGRF